MKTDKIKYFALAIVMFTAFGCVDENDQELPNYNRVGFSEDFNSGVDNTLLELPNWTNFAEVGSSKWKFQVYSRNGYAEFTSYQSGDAVNVGWLISPMVTLAENHTRKLRFQVAQSFVSSPANTLEVFISTDYDGTNVTAATWTPLEAAIPGPDAEYFKFYDSGIISLTPFIGNAYIEFKVTGSGTNQDIDGTYQIDNASVY